MRLASAVALGVIVASAITLSARIGVELPNGFVVVMQARFEPGGEFVPTGVAGGDDGRIHRFVPDRAQRRYFAYDLVAVASGADRLSVRIEPLSLTAAEVAKLPWLEPSWTAVPLLKFPLIPDVRAGDTAVIDLLQNPTTGQRVVDNLTFTRPASLASTTPKPARDFSLADVDLQLENARAHVNGRLVEASTRVGGGISGRVLWFYLAGRGRFEVSLREDRQRGFARLGEVVDRSLAFTIGADRLSIEGTSRIVPGEGRFNLYVRHQPEWRPMGRDVGAEFLLGAED